MFLKQKIFGIGIMIRMSILIQICVIIYILILLEKLLIRLLMQRKYRCFM